VYLEGTHRTERASFDPLRLVTDRPSDTRSISHDLAWVAERLGRRSLWADYRAGDVTAHSPHLVHASLHTTSDAMRLSAFPASGPTRRRPLAHSLGGRRR